MAASRRAAHHRVVRRPCRRCLARAADARGVVSGGVHRDGPCGERHGSAASAARVGIPRRRVRPDHRRQPGRREQFRDRLHDRYAPGAHRGPGAADTGAADPQPGRRRLEQPQPRSADRPDAVPVAGSRGTRWLSRRQHRYAARGRSRHGGHSLGTARRAAGRQQRSAPVGDSHQAAAQAPHRHLPRPRRRCRRRRRGACHRRSGGRSDEVPAAVRRTAGGDGRGARARRLGGEPALRPIRDQRARPHVARARCEDGDQCGARTRLAHRARRRPRRSARTARREGRQPARRGALGRGVPRAARNRVHAHRPGTGVRQLLPSRRPEHQPAALARRTDARRVRGRGRRSAHLHRRARGHRGGVGGGRRAGERVCGVVLHARS